jgi:hypothetical protein
MTQLHDKQATAYLQTLHKEVPGFDFRVKYDSIGHPEAICWMLPCMSMNLLCYGSIIFLDAMKYEYNDMAWSYIGPTVMEGEMNIRQVLECICIKETLEMYQFVLESSADMEPDGYLLLIYELELSISYLCQNRIITRIIHTSKHYSKRFQALTFMSSITLKLVQDTPLHAHESSLLWVHHFHGCHEMRNQ